MSLVVDAGALAELLLARGFEGPVRKAITPYDGAYLALAELGGPAGGAATLVTADGRFGRTARSIGSVPVVVVPVP